MKHFILLLLIFSLNQIDAQSIVRITQNNVTFRKCSNIKCPIIGKLKESTTGKLVKKENTETIDGYGTHPWYRVVIDKDTGSVFGALAEVLPARSKEVQLNIDGYITGSPVNIRSCGSLKCDIVVSLNKDDKVNVISKTHYRDKIGSQWSNWYFIDFQGVKGYVYGTLLKTNDPTILKVTQNAKIYNTQNGQVTHSMRAGQTLDILKKGESEVIRPFGRHYWYQVALTETKKGWIFGGLTSKSKTPVDCQCVDFVKHHLKINGPTKNAHEWDDILLGKITITQSNTKKLLNYQEITDSSFQVNDIVIFDNIHTEAHDLYGHIGFFKDIRIVGDRMEILIEGGNHPDKKHAYFTKNRCNNISEKWYLFDKNVRVFREL